MIEGKTKLIELFKTHKKAAAIFAELGLYCTSCKGIAQDTVEKVAVNNGIGLKSLLARLNER